MMAILEDALRCFQNNSDAKGGPRKRLFSEAEQWLIGEGGEGPFSFETVCENASESSRNFCAEACAIGGLSNLRAYRRGAWRDGRRWSAAVESVLRRLRDAKPHGDGRRPLAPSGRDSRRQFCTK